MAINESICLPVFFFYSEFVKVLIGRIPVIIIMNVAGILEKLVKELKEFWQNTFVPSMYKFESMQAIYY